MKIVLTLMLFMFLASCTKLLKWYTPDNPAEEFLEEAIRRQTGIDLDLSPWEDGEKRSLTEGEKKSEC